MRRHPGTFAAGLVFMGIGVAYVLQGLDVWEVRPGRVWPIALIIIGAVILLTGRSRNESSVVPIDESGESPGEDDAQRW